MQRVFLKKFFKRLGTMLCATIKFPDSPAITYANRHADLIELRHPTKPLRARCRCPVIFVAQNPTPDLLTLSPDYLDLPSSLPPETFERLGETHPQIKRICSYHNFNETPDLDRLYQQMRTRPAEIYKIATHANSILDALRLLLFVRKTGCVGIAMGEFGRITRVLAPVVGTPWSYAPVSPPHQTAPGQLTIAELLGIYRYRAHTPKTALYGLIGDPISQSPSYRMHNFAFGHLGLDALYVKMHVKESELPQFFPLAKELGFQGLSVTIPHKERVLPYLMQYTGEAINTIKFTDRGLYGWNTDGPGALDALERRMRVDQKHIVLLGAGGAARGIVAEAKKRGANLTIANRTLSKAKQLAESYGGQAVSLDDFANRPYDILINCTPVGMPICPELLQPKRLVMDIILHPTPLLSAASDKGCTTIEGIEMFNLQATYQYLHWFRPSNQRN